MKYPPTLIEEKLLLARGFRRIAGVDEAGRGPLAGPVVGAAVILPLEENVAWYHLSRDSKQLSAAQRERYYEIITTRALATGVGVVSCENIDQVGIAEASRQAMHIAVENLSVRPDFLLLDYFSLPSQEMPQKGIVKGDAKCLSIAAASIVAKVTRDRLMDGYDGEFPGYGFTRHKGYGTKEHLIALANLGPCRIHRRSFSPVQNCLSGQEVGVSNEG